MSHEKITETDVLLVFHNRGVKHENIEKSDHPTWLVRCFKMRNVVYDTSSFFSSPQSFLI